MYSVKSGPRNYKKKELLDRFSYIQSSVADVERDISGGKGTGESRRLVYDGHQSRN
jgi:hypothetical protein